MWSLTVCVHSHVQLCVCWIRMQEVKWGERFNFKSVHQEAIRVKSSFHLHTREHQQVKNHLREKIREEHSEWQSAPSPTHTHTVARILSSLVLNSEFDWPLVRYKILVLQRWWRCSTLTSDLTEGAGPQNYGWDKQLMGKSYLWEDEVIPDFNVNQTIEELFSPQISKDEGLCWCLTVSCFSSGSNEQMYNISSSITVDTISLEFLKPGSPL